MPTSQRIVSAAVATVPLRIVRSSLSIHQLHDPLRRQRVFVDHHTVARKRVLHGGDHRGETRDGAAFAGALDADRVPGGGGFHVLQVHARHVGGGKEEVFAVVRGLRLAGVAVVNHALEEDVADAVGDAADDLAIDEDRVDDAAAVVGDVIIDDARVAGFGLDLDDGDVGAVGVHRAFG